MTARECGFETKAPWNAWGPRVLLSVRRRDSPRGGRQSRDSPSAVRAVLGGLGPLVDERAPDACVRLETLLSPSFAANSGGGGIRTLETGQPRLTVFKTVAFNRSATPPGPA